MKVRIYEPRTNDEFDHYYELRWIVLRKPWKKPRGSEKDDIENNSTHIMACIEKEIVGVGRIHLKSKEKMQIRYMAVKENYRSKGIGTLILKELEKRAKNKPIKYIILNARENALQFYINNGYSIIAKGDTLFDSIYHWRMQKILMPKIISVYA